MTKSVETLVDDIMALFGSGKEPSPERIEHLSKAIAYHVANAFKKRDYSERKGSLRGSRIGSSCDRKQWYDTNEPEEGEELSPEVLFKFLYGNILEETVLFLAEEAEHDVKERQALVSVDGVEGHIDAVIDGVLVDIKSSSSRGMYKFKNNGLKNDDPFGYLPQIEFYLEGIKTNEAIQAAQDRYGFLAFDKESGRLCFDLYQAPGHAGEHTRARVARNKAVVSRPEPPVRGHVPVPDGSSGNLSLDTPCRYCSHKLKCWSNVNDGAGLRAFKYSNGVKFLTKVVKRPLVDEVNPYERSSEET